MGSSEGNTALNPKLEMCPSELEGTRSEKKEFPLIGDSGETDGIRGRIEEPATILPSFLSGKNPDKFPE
ncbi:hypothetical protein MTHERMMSTA1_24590 [Methanosarcina thermophila MST-A1]|uniref:Uncharacterized protein n=1 Tax=Methanosarcina thermophila TaxID=2210 RepID=A0A3G9CST9_METTE|nr:conserved hypothetical protein [Methanosarcina thermophila]GLI15333.1 hypothetical protein MTHERMMSTA1_24590 [Methanosarcina thermophila MST-A1]